MNIRHIALALLHNPPRQPRAARRCHTERMSKPP
ncbi:MAG: hypothetical protein RLZZ584_1745, partial [Pseudomonadota bacterium]